MRKCYQKKRKKKKIQQYLWNTKQFQARINIVHLFVNVIEGKPTNMRRKEIKALTYFYTFGGMSYNPRIIKFKVCVIHGLVMFQCEYSCQGLVFVEQL